MSDVQTTMNERGARYGDFTDVADTAQGLQEVMRETTGWERLNPVQRQALTAIADKIGRILSGDPNYADNWHDIQGYARLVEERLTPPVSQRDEREFPLVGFYSDTHVLTGVERVFNDATQQVQVICLSGDSVSRRMSWQDVAKLSAVHPVYIRTGRDGGRWTQVRPTPGQFDGMIVERDGVWLHEVINCDGHKADV